MNLFHITQENRYRTVLLKSDPLVRYVYLSRLGLIEEVSQWLYDNATDERTERWPGYQVIHDDASVTVEFTNHRLATAFMLTWG